jgi:hypothetical protein
LSEPVKLPWCDRQLSRNLCATSWIGVTTIFVAIVSFLGGPTEGDSGESIYSTLAIAHGRLSCAYPPHSTFKFPGIAGPGPFIAPVYPLLSGAVAALLRLGRDFPFPSPTQLGPNCSNALTAMYHWTVEASVIKPMIRIGYLSLLVLMCGVITLVRAVGRGRKGWEPFALISIVMVPPVWMCLLSYFHPQDIIAVGLILCAMACVNRESWIWAGILIGLAITTQQFSLLAAAPLLVVAPRNRRLRFAGATLGSAVVVIVPLVIATSGRAFKAAVIGSGFTKSFGGTILWETHIHGSAQFAVSRLLPIILAMGLAYWAVQRLGPAVLEPVPLISLITTTLSFRIVFEENLFGYYFMAISVFLVLLDIVSGRIRGYVVAWIALVTVTYNPIPWGFASNWTIWGRQMYLALPIVFALVALAIIIYDIFNHRVRLYICGWLVLVTLEFVHFPGSIHPILPRLPAWIWQFVLISTAITLAFGPLLKAVQSRPNLTSKDTTFNLASSSESSRVID